MTTYNITRKKASILLNMSTRSIDRYVKSGKLRAKKKWKVVYINEDDINIISSNEPKNQEIIMPENNDMDKTEVETNAITTKTNDTVELIFSELKKDIDKKDDVIKDLAIKLWRAEEVAKNSISLIEFKKSQFLLEESKWYLNKEVEDLRRYKKILRKQLNHEKKTNYILITFTIVLFMTMIIIWFSKI